MHVSMVACQGSTGCAFPKCIACRLHAQVAALQAHVTGLMAQLAGMRMAGQEEANLQLRRAAKAERQVRIPCWQ